jgi:4'-phosphopantetheinyl transferase
MPLIDCHHIEMVAWDCPTDGPYDFAEKVDVWRIPIERNPGLLDYFLTLLLPEERERSQSYQRKKDRQRFITARGVLRTLLSKYLGTPPTQIQLISGPNKKPVVLSHNSLSLHYSIAHSGEWILIAISHAPVGIDLEKIEEQFSFWEIIKSSFSPDEISFVEKSVTARVSFYWLWTRKEALAKATAKGLDDDLAALPCLEGTHEVEAELIGSPDSWSVGSFVCQNEHLGSVAYHPGIKTLRFRDAAYLFTDK